MGQFHHPSARLKSRILFDQLLFLAPGPDVGSEAVGFRHLFLAHIRCVKTRIPGCIFVCGFDNSSSQQRIKGNAVMPVGAGDDE